MFPSIFTDELAMDLPEALPVIKGWGLRWCDLRGQVLGKHFEGLDAEELRTVRSLLDQHEMRVGCLESSLAKVHFPEADRRKAEEQKLEAIVRAADALECRLVRAFFYWQPPAGEWGTLPERRDLLERCLEYFAPLAERARAEGLLLAFENCGCTPEDVFAFLDAVGVPSWGLAWDVHNGWRFRPENETLEEYLPRLATRSRLLHVKARGALPGLDDFVIPYEQVLQVADNAGVRGPVSVETHNPDKNVPHVEMSRRVVEVVKKAWPSAAPGGLFDSRPKDVSAIARPWANDPVRFVVVGLGMGHNRAKMIQDTPGAELVGVCDIREDRARRTSEACGVPYSLDVREWPERDDVEAVFVLTETGRHGEIALQALEAGKHVLTTKPMDASLEACDAMVRAAEERGLLLAVDFSRRFESGTLSVRGATHRGRFGRMLSANGALKILRTMEYFRANGGWRGTWRWDGGGVLSNQSIHHIDEMVFILGVPEKVRCDIWTQTHDIEAEDLGTAVWQYADGLIVTWFATSSYPHSTWYYRLELQGTEGAYFAAAGGPFEKPVERWFLDGAWSGRPAEEHVESEWLNSVDNFAAAIRAGAPLVCSGRDGRRTQSVLDAMYRSAKSGGGWVDVAPDLPEAGG